MGEMTQGGTCHLFRCACNIRWVYICVCVCVYIYTTKECTLLKCIFIPYCWSPTCFVCTHNHHQGVVKS